MVSSVEIATSLIDNDNLCQNYRKNDCGSDGVIDGGDVEGGVRCFSWSALQHSQHSKRHPRARRVPMQLDLMQIELR